jgi:hypothetical protein
MLKSILITISTLLALSFYAPFCLANTSTKLTITKTTQLTENDASTFANTFGIKLQGDDAFQFLCQHGKCKITATKDGFSGKLAETLLRGRSHATFVSLDKKFTLDCGKTRVAYCNVIQKDAVLA